jgi:penicillin-binding protein 2
MRRIRKTPVEPRLHGEAIRPARPATADPDMPIRRAGIMGIAFAFGALTLIARLWYLQIARGDDYVQMALANHTRLIQEPAPRGLIVDCHGRILATTRPRYAIYAAPDVARNSLVLQRLGDILGIAPGDIADEITADKKNEYDLVRIALDVPMDLVTQIEEQRPYLPGVSASPEPVRWYPNGALLGNTLGTLGRVTAADLIARGGDVGGSSASDVIGKTGLERQYDADLCGTRGGVQLEIDAHGRPIQQTGQSDPIPGHTLHLTVDSRVEAAAEQVFHAKGWSGAAVAVNPQTGAVLALASSPAVDPNLFVSQLEANQRERLEPASEPQRGRALSTWFDLQAGRRRRWPAVRRNYDPDHRRLHGRPYARRDQIPLLGDAWGGRFHQGDRGFLRYFLLSAWPARGA